MYDARSRTQHAVGDAERMKDDLSDGGDGLQPEVSPAREPMAAPETSQAAPKTVASSSPDVPQPARAPRGTLMLDTPLAAPEPGPSPPSTGTPSGGPPPLVLPGASDTHVSSSRGTIMLEAAPAAVAAETTPVTYQAEPEIDDDQPPIVSPGDSEEQLTRLEYVCHLLRRTRRPLCPINGILVLIPRKTIQAGARESRELERAAKADVATVQQELQLRCPTTALLVGNEEDPGFGELVRRVGRERAAAQRFGKRFDVRSLATPDQLAAFCIHVAGVFEDWIYTLFREKDALTRPGNTHLYGLLCNVRTRLQRRLTHILVGSFGWDAEREKDADPVPFSGCYFAATGETEDRQAFVRGVFDKLVEEQGNVEWTSEALAESRRLRWFGYLGTAIGVVLALWLIGRALPRVF